MRNDPHDLLQDPGQRDSYQIEVATLSILMNFPAAYDDVASTLKPEHFMDETNRLVFAELQRQSNVGRDWSIFTLQPALDDVLTLAELSAIRSTHDHSARGINRMVQTLLDNMRNRQLHGLAHTISTLAFETTPIQDRIDCAQAELSKLDSVGDTDEWIGAHQAAIEHLELLDSRESGKVTGIETGLPDLDEILDGGLVRGNLVVIGARPAMGKTALAMTIGLHMAARNCIGFLSMEMPHNDVRDRQAAILGRSSISHIKRPSRGLAFDRIVEGVEKAKELRWFVSDKSGLNIMQVRSKARALKRKHALDVLIVDYIGLMSGMDSKQPRAYQIEEISRGLKGLSKELDITVICLAQVNRGATERAGQVPGLQDLRDSGAIEQDADVVAFIHRPIEANPDAGDEFQNYGLLRVAKNRQGRTGDVHLTYAGEFTMFQPWHGLPPTKRAEVANKTRGMS